MATLHFADEFYGMPVPQRYGALALVRRLRVAAECVLSVISKTIAGNRPLVDDDLSSDGRLEAAYSSVG